MSGGNDHQSRMEQVAESAWSKVLARFGTPILIGIIGWLVVNKLNSNDASMAKIAEKQDTQAVSQAELRGDVKRIDEKIDSTVLYQVSDLRRRVDQLEAASKTP